VSRLTYLSLGGVLLIAAASLGGCTYDYTQHSDRIAYSAGDAVKANLEAETVDPSNPSMYSKKGLGKNGRVIPATTTSTSTTSGSSTPAP